MKYIPLKLLALCSALVISNRLLAADEITVNLNSPRQTIDGIGYNHEGDRQNGDTYIIDSNIQQMLDEGITLFRDMFPNRTWEPSRGTFQRSDARVVNAFKRLKTMQDRGITTILGIWDLPNWLITSATQGNGGGRRIANVNDVADVITSFLVEGKNVYGLNIDYVDFNETAESGVNIYLTATEYSNIITACESRFAANGLVTKFNQGSTLLWDRAYDTAIYNSTRTLAHAGLPTWHTYRGGSLNGVAREPLQLWKDWGAWALTLDRRLWATETDYDAFLYEKPERLTWDGSQETAVMYWRTLYVARCSTMAGWYWHSDWSSYPIHTSYINNFKPGGQILDTRRAGDLQPGDYAEDQVFALGYRHVAQNKFVLQVLNQSSAARPANFHGLPANTVLTLIRTASNGDKRTVIGNYTTSASGDLSVSLLGDSFNSFTGPLGSTAAAPVVHLTSPANGAVFTQPATITLSATASSPSGINRVEFYDGTTLIGTSNTAPYSYTWTNVAAGAHLIAADAFDNGSPQQENFSDNSASIQVNTATSYTIAASAGTNGSISPSGSISVAPGANQTFTITTNSGYAVSSVLVDGASVGAVSTYSFSNVQANHAISATFAAVNSGPNIAYQRPVWTSSIQGAGYEGSKAVDANGNTRWSSAFADHQSIYVDLGANYNVNRVRLAWENAYAKDYQIQFSTNGTTWTTVREFWGKTSAAADNQTGLTGTARYVKVYCVNRATQYGFSLWEFEVYGTPAP